MCHLIDTLNNRTTSRHHTLDAALAAKEEHARDIRKANGQQSHTPTTILVEDGREIGESEVLAAESTLHQTGRIRPG